jgi:hypothetical protein
MRLHTCLLLHFTVILEQCDTSASVVEQYIIGIAHPYASYVSWELNWWSGISKEVIAQMMLLIVIEAYV